MRLRDLHLLPKFRDGLSYLYVEHCRIDREMNAIALHDKSGTVPVPCASLALLMLGPGTNITHAAVSALADNGCLILWCGEQAVRFYAQGMGETRKARNTIKQARLCSTPHLRLKVVRNMYEMRFKESLDAKLSLQQIRGMEGIRVRNAYKQAAQETGVPWKGRSYDRNAWESADPVNRALSSANSCLYGICQAAIVSTGFSPALGFIHTGKMNSFSYDIADLYKTEITIPIAFRAAVEGEQDIDRKARLLCRDIFQEMRLLERIIPDIERALSVEEERDDMEDECADLDGPVYHPGSIWDPELETIEGGVNYGQHMD